MASATDLGVDDVLDVVQNIFGIEGTVYKTNKGLQYKFLCVVHQDSDPSAAVHLETGYWNCWSCRGGGDLIDLGKRATGKSRTEIRKLIAPDNPAAKAAAVSRRARAAQGLLRASQAKSEGRSVDVPQDYPSGGNFRDLKRRGFSKQTLRDWGVRYVEEATLTKEDGKEFTVDHAFAIPIKDSENGSTLGWCYRSSTKSRPWFRDVRYIYTPGINNVLNRTWFGLWENRSASEIVVTEGALDAMWVTQCGFPSVAILGNQAKQVAKIRKLMRFRNVTLFLDHDETGVGIASYLGDELIRRGVSVSVVRFASFMSKLDGTPAKDANDLCPMDVEIAIARALPFSSWKALGRRGRDDPLDIRIFPV